MQGLVEQLKSPLLRVISDPHIHQVLETIRHAIATNAPVIISKEEVSFVREQFSKAISDGEGALHHLSSEILQLICGSTKCNMCLDVYGRCANPSHARLLKQEIWFNENDQDKRLLGLSDSVRATMFTPWCIDCNQRTQSIASTLDYYPTLNGSHPIVFMRTRIKSTSNIAYKIADIVFDIDLTFKRDKIYNKYSQQIKDLYGIKCVVARDEKVMWLRNQLCQMKDIKVVEEKDYTGSNKKGSGFEAYKLVIEKAAQVFEIQIQSNRMYDEERLSWNTSHKTYKEKQMKERQILGIEYLRVFEALVTLFSEPEENKRLARVELGLSQKGLDDQFL